MNTFVYNPLFLKLSQKVKNYHTQNFHFVCQVFQITKETITTFPTPLSQFLCESEAKSEPHGAVVLTSANFVFQKQNSQHLSYKEPHNPFF